MDLNDRKTSIASLWFIDHSGPLIGGAPQKEVLEREPVLQFHIVFAIICQGFLVLFYKKRQKI